jgi:hypothetical protein
MADNGLKALEAELGAEPPAGLAQLTESQLTELATAVRDARHRQAAQLAEASDQSLKHIPRLLRLPIRKVLG